MHPADPPPTITKSYFMLPHCLRFELLVSIPYGKGYVDIVNAFESSIKQGSIKQGSIKGGTSDYIRLAVAWVLIEGLTGLRKSGSLALLDAYNSYGIIRRTI